MEWFDMFDKNSIPMQEDVEAYIGMEEFKEFHQYVAANLKLRMKLEYSSCSLEKGWNIKYKKVVKIL